MHPLRVLGDSRTAQVDDGGIHMSRCQHCYISGPPLRRLTSGRCKSVLALLILYISPLLLNPDNFRRHRRAEEASKLPPPAHHHPPHPPAPWTQGISGSWGLPLCHRPYRLHTVGSNKEKCTPNREKASPATSIGKSVFNLRQPLMERGTSGKAHMDESTGMHLTCRPA